MLRVACCVPCSNLVATLFAHLHSRWSETESAKMTRFSVFRIKFGWKDRDKYPNNKKRGVCEADFMRFFIL